MVLSSHVVVPEDILEAIKCVYCSLYLSVPPITYDQDKNLVCGRCKDDSNTDVRAKAFEAVAKLLLFPCRYVPEGCGEKELNWELVQAHEMLCNYRSEKCIEKSCKWQGKPDVLLEHFHKSHEDLVLLDSKFNFDLLQDMREIKLIPMSIHLFLLELTSDSIDVCFNLSYVNTSEDKNVNNFNYQLELINSNDKNTLKFSGENNSEMIKLNMDSIKKLFNASNLFCKIKILDIKNDGKLQEEQEQSTLTLIDHDLLNDLECPVCTEYMVPPIFVCDNGHSICEPCKSHTSTCLICRGQQRNTRNFSLEKLVERLKYPCKNRNYGCKFVGDLSTIYSHHKACNLNPVACTLQESEKCNWKGMIDKHLSHLQEKHLNISWMIINKTWFHDLSTPISTHFNIIAYDGELFKICCRHKPRTKGSVSWAFHHVGLAPNELSPYRIEIQFEDQSKNGRKFIINTLSKGVTNDDDAFKNSLTLSYDLLIPFINSGKYLILKYDVYKM